MCSSSKSDLVSDVRFISFFYCLMTRHPPISTRTDTLLPYTPLCRSAARRREHRGRARARGRGRPRPVVGRACLRRLITAQPSLPKGPRFHPRSRSEEHTSELQSLMRISYAVFCLKKKKKQQKSTEDLHNTKNYRHNGKIQTGIR